MTMPVMDMYEIGFMSRQTGTLVRKDEVDFRTVEVEFPLSFDGMLTAVKTQTEKTKLGVRTWQGCKLYCDGGTEFVTDDVIVLPEGRFRVVSPINWSRNGYNCYQMEEVA